MRQMIPSLSRGPQVRIRQPVVLVGLMGVGKTTVGRRLAQRLRVPFRDADHEIEQASNMRVSEFFETYGEEAFREGERKVIERLLQEGPMVLATGGGAFMNELTRAVVKDTATSVWLRAELDILVRRTAKRDTRPLLRQGDPREILAKLLQERAPIYAQADIAVDSLDGPHHRTVERIIKKLSVRRRQGHQI